MSSQSRLNRLFHIGRRLMRLPARARRARQISLERRQFLGVTPTLDAFDQVSIERGAFLRADVIKPYVQPIADPFVLERGHVAATLSMSEARSRSWAMCSRSRTVRSLTPTTRAMSFRRSSW